MSSAAARFCVFVIVMAVILGWLGTGQHEYASAARFFLKELFRQMF